MKPRPSPIFRVAVAFLLFCLLASAQAQTHMHSASGMAFPDKIGAFVRVGEKHFEEKYPGVGSAYHYRSAAGTLATVYVYTAGAPKIPDTIEDPVMHKLRLSTIDEIVRYAKSQGSRIEHKYQGTIPVQIGKPNKEVRVLVDGFAVHYPDRVGDTQLWLWTARRHFIKIRASDNRNVEQTIAFGKEVVKLSYQ